jgi:hypothetical protein
VERDLAWRGIDLGTEWRTRRWRKLLNLIDGLPRDSAYAEAQSLDEDLAKELMKHPEPERKDGPAFRMREHSAELEMLMRIFDRLGEVIQAQVASAGGKPPKIKPIPRPVTALEVLRNKQRWTKHRSVVSRVLPGRGDTPAPRRPPERPPSAGVRLN